MAQTNREAYEGAYESLAEKLESDRDIAAIRELCDAYDEMAVGTPTPEGENAREVQTLRSWLSSLAKWSQTVESDLLDATADEYADAATAWLKGTADVGPADGYAKSTVSTRQRFVRRFLTYHDGETGPTSISAVEKEGKQIDPSDMLDSDEIEAMRGSAGHPRDRALFDFLLYTGQRRKAALTLRWGDVDLAERKYRLNPDTDGLKGADDVATWRPLLGARGSLETWADFHPDSDDDAAFVFTARPDSSYYDPRDRLSDGQVHRTMEKMADGADVSKPTNPHALRHNFVTMAKQHYDMPDDVIKRLIGHAPDSDVMQTTYAHLSDEDYAAKAREAFGIETGRERSLTPVECPTCGEGQPPEAKACNRCGTVFTPDAQAAKEGALAATHQAAKDATTDDEKAAVDAFREVATDPELLAEAMNDDDVQTAFANAADAFDS